MDDQRTRSPLTSKPTKNHVVVPSEKEGDDWHIVSRNNWWKTSFRAVSWTFEQLPPTPGTTSAEEVSRSRLISHFVKPPHYHLGLFNGDQVECVHGDEDVEHEDRVEEEDKEESGLKTRSTNEWQASSKNKSSNVGSEDGINDMEAMVKLNEDLVGVRSACEVMKSYEGVDSYLPSLQEDNTPTSNEDDDKFKFSFESKFELDKKRKERWRDFVEELMDGKTLKTLVQESLTKAEARKARSTATTTSQKRNTKPLFGTGTGADYFSRLIQSTTKTFRLNPTASSFVPIITSPSSTFSSLPPLSFRTSTSTTSSSINTEENANAAFSFPTLNTSNTFPSSIGASDKRNQAHAHQDPVSVFLATRSRTSSSTSSSGSGANSNSDTNDNGNDNDCIPPFLQESMHSNINQSQRRRPTRVSRTRAIVDQLRSCSNNGGGGGGGGVVQSLPTSQGSSPVISDLGFGLGFNLSHGYLTQRMAVSENGALSANGSVSGNSGWSRRRRRRMSLISSYSGSCSSEEEDSNAASSGVNANVAHHTAEITTGTTAMEGGWTLSFPTTNPHTNLHPPVDPETKRNRSKELFLALRRRTDSLSSASNANSNNGSTVSLPLPGTTTGMGMGVRSRSGLGYGGGVGLGLGVGGSGGTPSVWSEPERLVESPEPQEEEEVQSEHEHEELEERRDDEEVYNEEGINSNSWNIHPQHRHARNTSTTSNPNPNTNNDLEGSPSYSSPSPTLTPPPITPTHIYPHQYSNPNSHAANTYMNTGTSAHMHMHTYPSVSTHYTHSHSYTQHPQPHTHTQTPAYAHGHTYTQHPNYTHKPSSGAQSQGGQAGAGVVGGIPYAFLPLPLMNGLPMPMNVGMNGMNMVPMPIPMTNISMSSTPTLPVPIPVPVPLRVQGIEYSTLMHLRIMQQMRVMRNSMGFNGVGVGGGGGRGFEK